MVTKAVDVPARRGTSRSSQSSPTSTTPRFTPSSTASAALGGDGEAGVTFVFRGQGREESASAGSIMFTPSATPSIGFGTQGTTSAGSTTYTPSATPSFSFRTQRHEVTTSTNSTTYTHSATPSLLDDGGQDDGGQDIPIPSIESDESLQSIDRDVSLDRHLQDLRIGSRVLTSANERAPTPYEGTVRSRAASTPSIQVTPTPTPSRPDSSAAARSRRTDSIVNGIDALGLGSDHAASSSPIIEDQLRTLSPRRPSNGGGGSPSRRSRPRSPSMTPIHRVEDEELPQALFHARSIQDALSSAKKAAADMASALSSSNLHREQNSAVRRLYDKACLLRFFTPPSVRIVGLVGDSGAGKSSLINSLLDIPDLARASNSGAACTCVVTEYHYHEHDQIAVNVEYFSSVDLRKQFEDLLHPYRNHEFDNGDSDVEKEDLKIRAELAKSTFKAAFRHRFSRESDLFLRRPIDETLDTMIAWVTQMVPQIAQGQTAESREAFDNIEQCSGRLQLLTSETEGQEITLWPFIRKIRVYLKAHILSKGLVIADLPGLRDLNSARQNVTERYIRECHQIFAVTRVGRAATDMGVKEVFNLARRARLSSIGIVCTMADEIYPEEAKRDWPREKERIIALEQDLRAASQDKADIRSEIDEFDDIDELDPEGLQEYRALRRSLKEAESRAKQSAFELKKHLITVRNRKLEAVIRKKYVDTKIFCVSNTIYRENRQRTDLMTRNLLDLSGIIGLRRYCIGIIADSHLSATLEYIKDEVPALIRSVELWVQAGSGDLSAERKEKVLEVAAQIQDRLDELTSPVSQVNDIAQISRRKFRDQMGNPMRQRADEWGRSAGYAFVEWEGWHSATFAAFCRNYGDHVTLKVPQGCCWNQEATALMKVNMTGLWSSFITDMETYLSGIYDFIDTQFASMLTLASTAATSNVAIRDSLAPLLATIRHRKALSLHNVETKVDSFQIKMLGVIEDALSPVRTAIIGQLMETNYNAAIRECGSGSDLRKKAIIKNGFRSPTLFSEHRTRFIGLFVGAIDALQREITDCITQEVVAIESDLDTLRSQNVIEESERNPEFRRELAQHVGTMQEELKRISRVVDGVIG